MKIGIYLTFLAVLLCSCRPNGVLMKTGVSVACAPQNLGSNQWATLTILQVWQRNTPQMSIREDQLGKFARYAKRSEIYDTNKDGSGYRVLVYSIRPLGNEPVIIDKTLFRDVPDGFPPPVVIRPNQE